MTLREAINRAVKLAKVSESERYVVYSRAEMGIPGNDYHVADLEDTETFFDGAPIVAYVSSSGDLEEIEGRRLCA